jgi:hypothetical protein
MSRRAAFLTPRTPTDPLYLDFEARARQLWLTTSDDRKFRHCDACRRLRDVDGRPLLTARIGRRYLCLACFDLGEPCELDDVPLELPRARSA